MNYLIVVRRHRFTLDLYRRIPLGRKYKLYRHYPIAVGMKGLETPQNAYEVQHMSRHPAYVYPDSQWVRDLGVLPGTMIGADDPNNPVAPRWIGISDDELIGIHGTNHPETLGTAASHGCIRLAPESVVEVYRKVRKGTPVVVF